MRNLIELSDLIKQKERRLQILEIKHHKTKAKTISRKKRTHELIRLGALMEIANLFNEDRGILLGWLFKLNNATPEERKDLKLIGQRELSKREDENKFE
jgi:hypothetical protein